MWKESMYSVLIVYFYLLCSSIPVYSENIISDNEGPELNFEYSNQRLRCPSVKPMNDFDIFRVLGSWHVVQYYSSSEEALTYHCMRVEFGLSQGNMDMRMRLTYKYADDPNDEIQFGNMTWQIPDPTLPGHWRHTEDHYKGVYNTDVVDTDYENWLLLLHCSDDESDKKFLSTFILSRNDTMDANLGLYLREKAGQFDVDLEYLFPVNQTNCVTVTSSDRLNITPIQQQQPQRIPFIMKEKKSRRARQSRG